MKKYDFEDDDKGVFQRHRWLLPLIIAIVAGGAYFAFTQIKLSPSAPVKARDNIMVISIPPPLPPPPPPPPPPPKVEEPEPPKEQMVAQEEVKPDEPKPEAPKPADEPPPISTGLTGDGPGMSGLGAYAPGQGNGSGIGGGGGRKGGSKFGWYAAQVQRGITDALKRSERMRFVAFSVKARIWADSTGRIVRASLSDSTGDAAVDASLTNDILNGLQLTEPPPADMPMPIVMRLNAKPQGGVASAR